MIKENEVFKIGKLVKPHGIKGEISFAFDNLVFDQVDCPFLICRIDDILTPFFIKEYRFKGKETALITFEDIDNENKAKHLAGLEVYLPREFHQPEEDDEYSWSYFIGFQVIDDKKGELGIIEAIDDNTMNVLFLVKNDSLEYIIPATEEFISKIDASNKRLYMKLVDGLIE